MIKFKWLKLRFFIGFVLVGNAIFGLQSYYDGDCVMPPRGPVLCNGEGWGYALAYYIWLVVGSILMILSFRISKK